MLRHKKLQCLPSLLRCRSRSFHAATFPTAHCSSQRVTRSSQFQKLTMGEGGYIAYDAWYPVAPGHALGRYVLASFLLSISRCRLHRSCLSPPLTNHNIHQHIAYNQY